MHVLPALAVWVCAGAELPPGRPETRTLSSAALATNFSHILSLLTTISSVMLRAITSESCRLSPAVSKLLTCAWRARGDGIGAWCGAGGTA